MYRQSQIVPSIRVLFTDDHQQMVKLKKMALPCFANIGTSVINDEHAEDSGVKK